MSDDIVRVLRVVEYIGPRSWIDDILRGSLQGTTFVGPSRIIRTTEVGRYPDVTPLETKKDLPNG